MQIRNCIVINQSKHKNPYPKVDKDVLVDVKQPEKDYWVVVIFNKGRGCRLNTIFDFGKTIVFLDSCVYAGGNHI